MVKRRAGLPSGLPSDAQANLPSGTRAGWRSGWRATVSRALAATLGTYALVSALVAAAAHLPWPPADAILYPALLAIPASVALVIACFAMRDPVRLWLALTAGCLAALALRWGLAA